MITADQVLEEIRSLLAEKLNAQTVYADVCPKDFARPGYWVETVKEETDPVNFCTVRKRMYFSVTCFLPADTGESGGSASPTQMQTEVTALFRSGFLRLGSRALKVSAEANGHESDRSFVSLRFEFFDDLTDAEETAPLMGDVDVALKKGD